MALQSALVRGIGAQGNKSDFEILPLVKFMGTPDHTRA
jgi:hypothetical protein